MDALFPRIVASLRDVEVGAFFLLVGGRGDNPLCLRASFEDVDDPKERERVVPLHWEKGESSVQVPIYITHLPGTAIIIENARVDVDPTSATQDSGNRSCLYADGNRLLLPLVDRSYVRGAVDLITGLIAPGVPGTAVGFARWQVTVPDLGVGRKALHSSSAERE